MSTRRAKQLIYGTLFVFLWIAFFAAGYFLIKLVNPAPVVVAQCTSDCIPTDASAIATSTISAFITSPGHYTLLTQITNTANYAAESFDYSFDLYDAAGKVITSIPGQGFLYANQSRYIVAPNQIVSTPVAGAAFTITNVVWGDPSTLGTVPIFSQQNIQSSMTVSTVAVSGQITNTDIATFKKILVVVVFKGTSGEAVGATQTEIDNVTAGQTTNFSVSYPATTTINPVNNQVFVYGVRGN